MNYSTLITKAEKNYTYQEYRFKINEFVNANSCSGDDQSSDRIDFTRLNNYRMDRIEKQYKINDEFLLYLEDLNCQMNWVLIAESWCGDAAQTLPVIAKIADMTPNITLQIIFRDDNPEIMNEYLTNGGKAIPKLICFNKTTGDEVGAWGPRPSRIKTIVNDYKINHPESSHEEFLIKLHLWYGRDRGESVQKDFVKLIEHWSDKCQFLKPYEVLDLM